RGGGRGGGRGRAGRGGVGRRRDRRRRAGRGGIGRRGYRRRYRGRGRRLTAGRQQRQNHQQRRPGADEGSGRGLALSLLWCGGLAGPMIASRQRRARRVPGPQFWRWNRNETSTSPMLAASNNVETALISGVTPVLTIE